MSPPWSTQRLKVDIYPIFSVHYKLLIQKPKWDLKYEQILQGKELPKTLKTKSKKEKR